MFKVSYDKYNVEKEAYVKIRDQYNEAYTFNQEQKGDFFRSFLEPKKVVPERPCRPDLPMPFIGLILKFQPDWFSGFTEDQKKLKWAAFAEGDFTPDASASRKTGFL